MLSLLLILAASASPPLSMGEERCYSRHCVQFAIAPNGQHSQLYIRANKNGKNAECIIMVNGSSLKLSVPNKQIGPFTHEFATNWTQWSHRCK